MHKVNFVNFALKALYNNNNNNNNTNNNNNNNNIFETLHGFYL